MRYERDIRHNFADLPEGRIEDILSEKNLEEVVQRHKESPNFMFNQEDIRDHLVSLAWDQMVRDLSKNYLESNNIFGRPKGVPAELHWDQEDRGFILIDSGINSNCGYGSGNVGFYKIDSISQRSSFNESPLQVETITGQKIFATTGQYLSSIDKIEILKREKLDKRIVQLGGNWMIFQSLPKFPQILPCLTHS